MTSEEHATYLMQTAINSGIRDPKELANFMGQMQVESSNFTHMEEDLNYSGHRLLQVFPGRNGMNTLDQANAIAAGGPESIAEAIYGSPWGQPLGNTQTGDGWKYRGRGYAQLTGGANYQAMGSELELDLVNHPELAAEPEIAARIAVRYWQDNIVTRGLQQDVSGACRIINGGHTGLAERRTAAALWEKALHDYGYQPSAVTHVLEEEHVAAAHLHLGSHGPAVAELQTQLTQLGYTDNRGRPLHPDAHFGPATRGALEAFQEDNGLKPDGIAGKATLDKLNALAPHTMHVDMGTRVGQMLAAAETGDWQRLRTDTQEMLAQARAEVNGQGHPQQHGQGPTAQHGGQAAQADTRPFDPRHPQHPEHAMYCSVRDQLVALNNTQGITLTSGQLDNCTAALMADARAAGMRTIDSLQFSVHLDSNRTTDISQVVSFQGDPKDLAGRATATNMIQALDTPAAQSFQQFDQNTQVMAQQDQQLQQQRLAEQQSQGHGMSR